jgi:tetratricopeptide (TPR) repeat protein
LFEAAHKRKETQAVLTSRKITLIYIAIVIISFAGSAVKAADYKVYLDKADKSIAMKKYKDAIKNLRKAHKTNDKNPEIYRKMAFCFEQLNLPDSAISFYEGAIVFNPRDIDSYQKIGDIYYQQRDFHEAMAWYERGMDLGRLYPESYNKLGIIHLRWRELRKARDYFEKSIEVDSSFSNGYYGLGLIYMHAGDSLKAVDYFKKSVDLGSQPRAAYFIGVISFNIGRPDSAQFWLNKYLQQEPAGEYSPAAEKLLSKIKENKK